MEGRLKPYIQGAYRSPCAPRSPTLRDTSRLTSQDTQSLLARHALSAFEQVVGRSSGFRARPGQHAMAECVADTLARADLGDCTDPTKAIAVIQAGTGVGKSAAYASTAIAMALERKTRVLISTATVALQEQLMQKDLPALAATMDQPFAYALAKGRGRYVCKLKLERLVEEEQSTPLRGEQHEAQEERRMRLYEHMANTLATGRWDGDRDSLNDTPEPSDWATVAAERHSCTARNCPRYRECSYYQARTKLAEANVIVANHDLVLASLGMKTLPELDNCLVIFDEGHHLPAVALDQFSSAMDLTSLRWLDNLPKILTEVSNTLQLTLTDDVATVASQLKGALQQLARMALDLVHASTMGKDGTLRFANGVLPEALMEPVGQIHAQAAGLSKALEVLGAEVKALAKEDPPQALQCAQLYTKLGALARSLPRRR